MIRQELTAASALPQPLDFGIGFNWFDFLGGGGYYARCKEYPMFTRVFPSVDDHRGWQLVLQELDRLKAGCIRFGLPPDPILDAQGQLIKDSFHFKHLDIIADWCLRSDAVFILDLFVIPEAYEYPVTPDAWTKNGMLNMAPRDNRQFAEKFCAPLLDHIIRERGWHNVNWFNPVNEPFTYGVWQTPQGGKQDYTAYVEMYAEIRRALLAAGLDQVKLIGIDSCDPMNFPVYEFAAAGVDLDPYIDAYSLHTYVGRLDYEPEVERWNTFPLRTLVDTYIRRLVRYTESRGKPLYTLEFGSYHGWTGDWSGSASPAATLYTAESVIRMVNVGVRGLMYWQVTDSNENDGWWSIFRVLDGDGDDRVQRGSHTYSTYRMLMNFMPRHSRVYPLYPGGRESAHSEETAVHQEQGREYPAQHVWATALESPDGHRHLLAVNDHPAALRRTTFNLPQGWEGQVFHKILKDPVRLGEAVQAPILCSPQGQIVDDLPPMSLQVYTTAAVESMLP